MGRGWNGADPYGFAPVGSQDKSLPRRRRVRLSRVAHPAAPLAEPDRQESGLHLAVEEVIGFGDGQGAGPDSQSETSNTRRSVAPVEPGAAGMVQLLPLRCVQTDVQLPGVLRLSTDPGLAPQTAPQAEHGHPGAPPSPPMGDKRRRDRTVLATSDDGFSLPLPDR